MRKVSLDDYRSKGICVFSGTNRGKAVAKAIKEEHGENVQITVPKDVFYIDTHFRAGFNKVLPSVKVPPNPLH